MRTASSVKEYISSSPKGVQGKLGELRTVIKSVAPKAEEGISYGMPYYSYKGRLVYFGLSKNHIGLYVPPPVIADHKNDLENYTTTKSAVHLSLDKKLPVTLIRKLVKARMKRNLK